MANRPKLDVLINIPAMITLGDNFKNGQGQYGPWWGWSVTHEGVEKTLFADQVLHSQLAIHPKGTNLTITRSQVAGTNGSTWSVAPAGMATTPHPAPSYSPPQTPATGAGNGLFTREEYRAERVDRAKEAFADAQKVLDPATFKAEDIRALAISFLIDEIRKNIPGPDEVAF